MQLICLMNERSHIFFHTYIPSPQLWDRFKKCSLNIWQLKGEQQGRVRKAWEEHEVWEVFLSHSWERDHEFQSLVCIQAALPFSVGIYSQVIVVMAQGRSRIVNSWVFLTWPTKPWATMSSSGTHLLFWDTKDLAWGFLTSAGCLWAPSK